MPVVVGRASRPTPLFEKALSAIVFNPSWTVPPDLAYHDLLPKIVADPHYLGQRRIDVYESWQADAARVDPTRIAWKRLGRGIQALMLRQRPGPGNGLGRMMFRMDGEEEIFLHDTPAREVFRQDRRDLSSGCIRVADAEGLARAVLDDETRRALPSLLARRDTFSVTLARPVPVRTVYETAWVDGRGVVNFRDDIYVGRAHVLPTPPPMLARVLALAVAPAPARAPAPTPTPPKVATPGRAPATPRRTKVAAPWMRIHVPGVVGLRTP
jgi:murein L,D-transpeptidase YcbB/YkuD